MSVLLIIHNIIKISAEGPDDDDSEILLVATGSTSNTEFASNQVQFYEKQEHGGYAYVVPEQCNLGSDYSTLPLPTASSLSTGIVVNDTIRLCEGYTTSGVRECYDIIPGQGYQARPPLDIPYGGHSVFLPEEGYDGSWWLANTTLGGTENIQEATVSLDNNHLVVGPWGEEQLPEPLSVTCLIRIPIPNHPDDHLIFLSGVPTTSSSTGNKNWIKGSQDHSWYSWTELPESQTRRLGGSCGMLTDYDTTYSTNVSVVVMAGGLQGQTSEFLRILHFGTSIDHSPTRWMMGPDVGESRSYFQVNFNILRCLGMDCSCPACLGGTRL